MLNVGQRIREARTKECFVCLEHKPKEAFHPHVWRYHWQMARGKVAYMYKGQLACVPGPRCTACTDVQVALLKFNHLREESKERGGLTLTDAIEFFEQAEILLASPLWMADMVARLEART